VIVCAFTKTGEAQLSKKQLKKQKQKEAAKAKEAAKKEAIAAAKAVVASVTAPGNLTVFLCVSLSPYFDGLWYHCLYALLVLFIVHVVVHGNSHLCTFCAYVCTQLLRRRLKTPRSARFVNYMYACVCNRMHVLHMCPAVGQPFLVRTRTHST
jgi:hypothetical protein